MQTPSRHWGTNPPPRNKYFTEIFSQSHLKLTDNKPNKDFISVERPQEVEKFKFDRKIFSSGKIKNSWCAGFERMT